MKYIVKDKVFTDQITAERYMHAIKYTVMQIIFDGIKLDNN